MSRFRWITAAVAACVCLGAFPAMAGADDKTERTVWYLGDTDDHPAWRGAQLGQEDNETLSRFAQYTVKLKPVSRGDLAALPGSDAVALIVGMDSPDLVGKLTRDYPDVPIVSAVSADDGLRELCRDNLFLVFPSQQMKADAVAQWRDQNGGADAVAVAHHPDFRKYSSAEVNARYRNLFDAPMDEIAWGGWAATRVLGDAIIRGEADSRDDVRQYLWVDQVFDGSKGAPMTFRETGQLRQPLWIVEDDEVVAEAPLGVEAAELADEEQLDTLGRAHCPDNS